MNLLESVPFRFYHIEEYSQNESKLIMVVHHAYRDPITMFHSMQQSREAQVSNEIKDENAFWAFFKQNIVTPLYSLKMLQHFYSMPLSLNCWCYKRKMETRNESDGLPCELIALQARDICRTTLEQRCADYKCTIPQVINSLLGQSLRDYSLHMAERFDWGFGSRMTLDSSLKVISNLPLPACEVHSGNRYLPCEIQMTTQSFKRNMKSLRKFSDPAAAFMASNDRLGLEYLIDLIC
jgi:hypothetical protein